MLTDALEQHHQQLTNYAESQFRWHPDPDTSSLVSARSHQNNQEGTDTADGICHLNIGHH